MGIFCETEDFLSHLSLIASATSTSDSINRRCVACLCLVGDSILIVNRLAR